MSDEFKKVDVWCGSFPSEQDLERYLDETYDDGDTALPLSAFAADQGETFYDHDLVEASFFAATADVMARLREHSFSASFAEAVAGRLSAVELGQVNTVLLVWGEQIARPRSVSGEGYVLHYLGRFDGDAAE